MASDRETRVPEPEGIELMGGADLLDGEPHFVEEGEALADALAAAHYILRYVGGTVQLAAVREPIAPDKAPDAFATTEYIFRWNPYELKRPVAEMAQGEQQNGDAEGNHRRAAAGA